MSLADVAGLLACPHCASGMAVLGRTLRCDAGHAFDIARQGYVNLLPGDARAGTADTAAMVAARAAFLGAGHLGPLTAAVVDAAVRAAAPSGCVVDVGAGTGHHLAAVLDALPGRVGLALDLSKHAARRAARIHPRAAAAVCDAWRRLPVRDGVVALALSIFAPRAGAELARMLASDGAAIVVTPLPAHLAELVGPLGLLTVDRAKEERLARRLGARLVLEHEQVHRHDLSLDHAQIAAAVRMGPSAHHVDERVLRDRTAALPPVVRTAVAVRIGCYRPVGGVPDA